MHPAVAQTIQTVLASRLQNLERADQAPRCSHIRANGVRCGSPALQGHNHCYFHHRARTKRLDCGLPLLEDANGVQLAIMQVLSALLQKKLDQKTAALLLYGLQTASINLRRVDFSPVAWPVETTDPEDTDSDHQIARSPDPPISSEVLP